MAKLPVALHLNSIREPLQQNVAGAFPRVKGLGWDLVQAVGFTGSSTRPFAEAPVTGKQQANFILVDLSERSAKRSGHLEIAGPSTGPGPSSLHPAAKRPSPGNSATAPTDRSRDSWIHWLAASRA